MPLNFLCLRYFRWYITVCDTLKTLIRMRKTDSSRCAHWHAHDVYLRLFMANFRFKNEVFFFFHFTDSMRILNIFPKWNFVLCSENGFIFVIAIFFAINCKLSTERSSILSRETALSYIFTRNNINPEFGRSNHFSEIENWQLWPKSKKGLRN